MKKTIEMQHFAGFRDLRGCASESYDTTAASPRELFLELGLQEAVPLESHWLKVAINDDFAEWDDPLEAGDRVVFMMPMSGG